MATFQGERFIGDQIDSLLDQTYKNWSLWISDDGSTDKTVDIIKEKFEKHVRDTKIHILNGPRRGAAANFMNLLGNTSINAHYYAFCDQDDVWKDFKIERALGILARYASDIPTLYCSRTEFIDHEDNCIGISKLPERDISFRNSIVQNICAGNTLIMNEAAKNIIIHSIKKIDIYDDIVAHDWWVNLIIAGANGKIIFDETPTLYYRQHGNNLVGSNSGLFALCRRFNWVMRNRYKIWNEKNIEALAHNTDILTYENQLILSSFSDARRGNATQRLRRLLKSGVYRQSIFGNIALYICAFLNKI